MISGRHMNTDRNFRRMSILWIHEDTNELTFRTNFSVDNIFRILTQAAPEFGSRGHWDPVSSSGYRSPMSIPGLRLPGRGRRSSWGLVFVLVFAPGSGRFHSALWVPSWPWIQSGYRWRGRGSWSWPVLQFVCFSWGISQILGTSYPSGTETHARPEPDFCSWPAICRDRGRDHWWPG